MNELGMDGSFWPSERQKLLLRTVYGGDGAAEAWESVRPGLDLDRLEVGTFPLLPLVHRQLERFGVDDPYLPRLRGIRRRTWYVNRLALERAVEALDVLQDSGAEPIVVDGWSVVTRSHDGDLTVRAVDGIDVLVSAARAEDAEAALRRAGYTRTAEWLPHARRLSRPHGGACTIHTRLTREFSDPPAGREPSDLAAAAVAADLAGTPVRLPDAADELTRTCLDGARATRLPAVIWVADALALLHSGATLDWHRLLRQARLLHGELRLGDALDYLRRALAAPVPDVVTDELAATAARRRERLAHRLAGRALPLVGPAPRTAVRFLQLTAARPVPVALATAPRFFCDELGVPSRTRLPRELARRARRNRREGPA